MRFYFGIMLIIGVLVLGAWRRWQRHAAPFGSQPLLVVLLVTISLAWSFAPTHQTYAGVAVSSAQLTQLRQLTAAEKTSLEALNWSQQAKTVQAQTMIIHQTTTQLAADTSMHTLADAVVTVAQKQAQAPTPGHYYTQLNQQLARHLGQTPTQVRALFKQLQRDAGLA